MTPEQLRGEATAIDRMHGETLTVEWRLRMAERLRAHAGALEEIAAKNTALDFAERAIEDAIYTEDGLDGDTGQRVIHVIREAREQGTFDKVKYGDLAPSTNDKLAAALEEIGST